MAMSLAAGALLSAVPGHAQSATTMPCLRGLLPASVLPKSAAGKAALAANFAATGAIQIGLLPQPTLLPFPQQQQQALRDAFISRASAVEFSDGLGTALDTAYRATASATDAKAYASAAPAMARLIAYTVETTAVDSNAAKYFFANGTTDGKTPIAADAAALLTQSGGVTDIYGQAYRPPAGSAGADPFGDSRPFQTEPQRVTISGRDYFGHPASSNDYLTGPVQDLRKSPSFPSGHTTYGYTEALLLGILVPQRYGQEIVRAAEYGNDRIILGAHYAMDVIAGRTLALYDLAHLLANDPRYVGQAKRRAPVIADYPAAVKAARAELTAALQAACGHPVAVCAGMDTGRLKSEAADRAFYAATQSYGLPVVYPRVAGMTEDVGKLAPEAGNLLTAAFPSLSLAAANRILTATEGPGGGFLDDGSAFGVYSRIDLYAAVESVDAGGK